MKIRKAIIPCGGLGTRFLPVTKSIAKEILPVIDTPVLHYIVDELAASGIEQVLIILSPGKEAIRDYFTPSMRWDKAVAAKPELAPLIDSIGKNVEISFTTQLEPRGSGDAVLHARAFTGDEPFCMCNGDDLIVSEEPATAQLIKAYYERPFSVLGVQKVARSETDKYGMIAPTAVEGRRVLCSDIIEKPKSDPPSLFAALGRYVLTPEIYESIEALPKTGKEVGLTDAICSLMKQGKVYAYEFEGRRYDMGDRFGALTATVDFALKRPELCDRFRSYLKSVLNDEV